MTFQNNLKPIKKFCLVIIVCFSLLTYLSADQSDASEDFLLDEEFVSIETLEDLLPETSTLPPLNETIETEFSRISYDQRFRFQQNPLIPGNRYYQRMAMQRNGTTLAFVSQSSYNTNNFPDNYSYYLHHTSDDLVRNIIIGRYRLSLGQGIAFAPALGFAKSASSTANPVKNYKPIRPHTSTSKMSSQEGIALLLGNNNWQVIPYYSSTKLDASIKENKISNIYLYGAVNAESKNSVREKVTGTAFQYLRNGSVYGGYFVRTALDREFLNPELSHQYHSTGMYFRQSVHSILVFGEAAFLDRKPGFITGLRWGSGKLRNLILFRRYSKNIPTRHGNPFSSQSSFNNEQGIYYGLTLKPLRHLTINAFFDVWEHPSPRHFEKMPTVRSEQFVQIVYHKGSSRIRIRTRRKDYDKYIVFDSIGLVRREIRTGNSFDFTCRLNSEVTAGIGFEYLNDKIVTPSLSSKGILASQMLRWQTDKFSVITQIFVFNSEATHYVYEYSVDGMWDNRPLSGDGLYTLLTGSLQVTKSTKIESKASWFMGSDKKIQYVAQLSYQY